MAQGTCLLMCKCFFTASFFCDFLIRWYLSFYSKTYWDFFFLQASQFLRIITFYATQLPGPNYHCHEVSDFVISWLLCAMSLWLGNTFVNLIIHRAHLWLDYHHPRMQLKSFWLIVSGDSLCVNICASLFVCPNSLSLFCHLTTVPKGVIYGCGDLIFSSHMIFTLVFVITYQKYGSIRWTFVVQLISSCLCPPICWKICWMMFKSYFFVNSCQVL